MTNFETWAHILNELKGKFFAVEYLKKDGSVRRLNGKVYEVIKPEKNYRHLIVKDMKKHGYRKVDPNTIKALKCGQFKIGSFSGE